MKLSDTIVIMHALKARQSTLRDYMHRCLQTTGPGERPYSIETEKEATLVQAAIEEAEEIAEELKRLRAKDAEHLEQRWIPCTERMPVEHKGYLTFPHYQVLDYGEWSDYGEDQPAGFHSWSQYHDCQVGHPEVTHWMPLPAPPSTVTPT